MDLLLRLVGKSLYGSVHYVVLNALARASEHLKEDELAKRVGLSAKEVRRVLVQLREDRLIISENVSEKKASRTFTFDRWYFDAFRFQSIVRLKIFLMFQSLDDRLKKNADTYKYFCPRCKNDVSMYEAMRDRDPATGAFVCGFCGSELEEGKGGDTPQAIQEKRDRVEKQLRPITDALRQAEAQLQAESRANARSQDRARMAAGGGGGKKGGQRAGDPGSSLGGAASSRSATVAGLGAGAGAAGAMGRRTTANASSGSGAGDAAAGGAAGSADALPWLRASETGGGPEQQKDAELVFKAAPETDVAAEDGDAAKPFQFSFVAREDSAPSDYGEYYSKYGMMKQAGQPLPKKAKTSGASSEEDVVVVDE